jgi:iron complex outermembrane recepter protein
MRACDEGNSASRARNMGRAHLWVLILIVFATAGSISARVPGTIEGTVVARANLVPVPEAIVFVEGRFQPVTTDRHGRFRLNGVPPGSWTLIVQRAGFAELRHPVSVIEAQSAALTIELIPAPTVSEAVTVTATRHDEQLRTLPVSVGAVSGEELRHMRPTHVAEPLNRIPGVQIVAFAGEGTHNSVRQPLCCRPTLLLMEDGVPLTSPAFYSTSLIRQVNYAQAGRIEVLKGPGTAVHGSDGMTGVINFISQDPPTSRQVDVSAEAGGAGYQRLLVSGGGTFGGQSLFGTLTISDRDGQRHDPSQRKSGSFRWTTLTRGGALFKSLVSVNRTDSTGTDDQTPEQFETRSDFNRYPIAFSDFTGVRASTSYEQQAGRTSWSVMPFFRYQDVDFVPGWQLSYNPVVWLWGEKSGGLRTQVRHDLAPMQLRLTFGVDADYTQGNRQEPRITPVEEDGVWVDWSLTAQPPDYDYAFTYRGVAAYGQVELSPLARLRLTTGVRVDAAGYDYDNHLSVVQTGFARRPADAERTFTRASPKLGATYALTNAVTLTGSYRRGFRVPTEQHLFKQGSSANTIDLQPIAVDAVEGGFRRAFGRRTHLDVSAYRMWLTDDILSFRAIDGVSAATNNGRSLHRGLEVSLNTALRADLRLDVGYGYARHTFTDWRPSAVLDLSGREMDGAPRHQRNAQLTYSPNILRGGRVQVEWLGMSDYWLDPQNTLRQDGYDVLHLRGSYVVAGRYEIYARLMNVFDTLYAAQAFFGDSRVPRYLSPGEYRTLYAGVSARF